MDKHRRVFTIKEQYHNIIKASESFLMLRKAKKTKAFNKAFKERIMLAITEVNGCSLCSYVHTKVALSSGMTAENIQAILSGDTSSVPIEQAVAVVFSQHFASEHEQWDTDVLNRLIQEYGEAKTELILASCYMITMTNGMGISLDHLWQRVQWKRNKESTLLYEIVIPFLTMSLFPTLVFIKLIQQWFGKRLTLLTN